MAPYVESHKGAIVVVGAKGEGFTDRNVGHVLVIKTGVVFNDYYECYWLPFLAIDVFVLQNRFNLKDTRMNYVVKGI